MAGKLSSDGGRDDRYAGRDEAGSLGGQASAAGAASAEAASSARSDQHGDLADAVGRHPSLPAVARSGSAAHTESRPLFRTRADELRDPKLMARRAGLWALMRGPKGGKRAE